MAQAPPNVMISIVVLSSVWLHPPFCGLMAQSQPPEKASRSLPPGNPATLPENPLDNRNSTRREAVLRQFGGTQRSERAVNDGLAWLAAHQRPDGIWDRRAFDRLCPMADRCSQAAVEELDRDADVAVSALTALAFLAAGHTHQSGPYAEHLSRVFSYILAQQDADGSFSTDRKYQNYANAIAAMAIAENYVLTNDPVLLEPLRRVIDKLVRSQQAGGGWDFTDDTSTNRNDTSVSTWVLMAFKSADAAGVRVPLETRFRMLRHFDGATMPSGHVWYEDKPPSRSRRNGDIDLTDRRYGPGMTAAGLFARSAFGLRLDDEMSQKQIDLLLDVLPNLDELSRPGSNSWYNEYYWYYGTLAIFNVGGQPWAKWNAALRKTIMENQDRPLTARNKRRHAYGSWPAFGPDWGHWCKAGGRIYATALNTLTLEIYYRYVPAYLSPQGLIGPTELRQYIAAAPAADHCGAVRLVSRFHADTAEPVLVTLLDSPEPMARLAAALELAALDSPMGLPVLRSFHDAGNAVQADIHAAIERLAAVRQHGPYGQVVESDDAAGMFLFDTQGRRVYYGQPVALLRDGQRTGTARVVRRFSAHRSAAARVETPGADVRAGDSVIASAAEE